MKFETGIPIGEGASGRVYKAWDPSLERAVALKLLRRDDPESVRRMLQEARVQARVTHPNVCQVYEVGETDDGRPYIAMQYIEGETLDRAVAGLTVEARIRLLIPVVEAVHAAHVAGLVHRDLKPGNVLVETDEAGELRPWVLDFGIAREIAVGSMTLTGQLIGTPGYVSPEQARGETRSLDRRSDVFSLGVILYEVVTGTRPFEATSDVDTLIRVLHEDPTPPRKVVSSVPPRLELIILHCLEKDPAARYPSARALAEDLERYLRGEPILARPPSRRARLKRLVARRPVAVALTAATLLSIVVLALVLVRSSLVARDQARLAASFEQRLDDIESVLELAHRLPLHDVRDEREQVRRVMARLRNEIRSQGPAAAGPGRYALGRGHLLLGEHEPARELLERAWSSGYRTPEVALALGRSLGALYSERISAAERIGDAELREESLERARVELRDRAQRLLLQATPGEIGLTAAERRWVDGLLALYSGQLERAERIGREVGEEFPWSYEAQVLIADAQVQQAARHGLTGEHEEAERLLDRARRALGSALTTAPSDPGLHLRHCSTWIETMKQRVDRGLDPDAFYPRAIEACEGALTADADLAPAHHLIAEAAWSMAEALARRGEDPGPALARGEASIERALELESGNPTALTLRGQLQMTRAQSAVDRDDGAGYAELSARAVDSYRRALEQTPGDGLLLYRLGNALVARGRNLSFLGADPLPSWEEAERAFERAMQAPGELRALILRGLCRLRTETGYYRFGRGDDPGDAYDRAIEACEAALEERPRHLLALNDLGMAYWSRAETEVAFGEDPRASFEQAIATFDRVLEIDPDRSSTSVNQSHVHVVYAQWQQTNGADPKPLLERAEPWLESFRQIYPQDYLLIRGKSELVRALSRAEQAGESADPFERPMETLELALASQPASIVIAALSVRIQRERAEWLAERGDLDVLRRSLPRALADAEDLIARDPGNAEVRVDRALLLAAATRVATPGERAEILGAARTEARRALELRPELRDRLGTLATETATGVSSQM